MKPSYPAKSAFFCRLKSISGLLLHSREWGRGAPPLASTRPHAQAARSLLRRKGIPVAGPRAALHASRCRCGHWRGHTPAGDAWPGRGAALPSWRSAVRRPQRRAARRARRCVGAATDLGPGSLFHSDCESVWRPAEQTSKNTTRFLCPPPPPPPIGFDGGRRKSSLLRFRAVSVHGGGSGLGNELRRALLGGQRQQARTRRSARALMFALASLLFLRRSTPSRRLLLCAQPVPAVPQSPLFRVPYVGRQSPRIFYI